MPSACCTAVPTPLLLSFGEGSGKSEAPACQGTPVRALVRLIFLLKCRLPERPHEPSTVPDFRAAASACPKLLALSLSKGAYSEPAAAANGPRRV